MESKRIVFITGGNNGLGYETVKKLLQSDTSYHVLLGSRSLERGKAAIETLQKEFPNISDIMELVHVDLNSDESISSAFEQVNVKFDHIDVLINNGGVSFEAQCILGEMTRRECFNRAYDTNVTGTQILTWTFMPMLLKSKDPRLLFVAGLSHLTIAAESYFPTPELPAGWPKNLHFEVIGYRCSKTALNMLMVDWNHKLKNDGVKVWGVFPGFLATDLGGLRELSTQRGASHPSVGAAVLLGVVEGHRDADVGKVVQEVGICPF